VKKPFPAPPSHIVSFMLSNHLFIITCLCLLGLPSTTLGSSAATTTTTKAEAILLDHCLQVRGILVASQKGKGG